MTMDSPPDDLGPGNSDDISNYSPFQIIMWFVMFGLGILFAYCFRTSIIRHMERRIDNRRNAVQQQQSSLRRVPTDAATARAEFLDKTLMSYIWDNTTEENISANLEDEERNRSTSMVAEDSKEIAKKTEYQDHGTSTSEISTDSKENKDEDNIAECSICLASFCIGDQVTKSNNMCCPHIFHRECVYEWLLEHFECPMCRKEFLLPHYVVNLQKCNMQSASATRDAITLDRGGPIEQETGSQVNADHGSSNQNEEGDSQIELGNVSSENA